MNRSIIRNLAASILILLCLVGRADAQFCTYDATNWYWQVTDSSPSTTRFSTASYTFVSTSDGTYLAWVATGCVPWVIDTAANLYLALAVSRNFVANYLGTANYYGLSETLTRTTASGGGSVTSAITASYTDNSTSGTGGLSNQPLRVLYTWNGTTASTSFDAMIEVEPTYTTSTSVIQYGINLGGPIVSNTKTVAAYTAINIGAKSGAGSLTTPLAIVIASGAGGITQNDTHGITSPVLNLSGSSSQLVFNSTGVMGTLSWTPSSSNKTITLPNGTTDFTATGPGALVQASSGAAFTVATLSPALGGTGVANNASSTLTISGSFATTVTVSNTTTVTLPTTGTLATLAGSEEFTNKTLNASVGKGTWTASGTWTLPAVTLGGAITYGGVTLSNAVTGTGNMVLSASPTLSGTVAGTLTFSGGITFSNATITSTSNGIFYWPGPIDAIQANLSFDGANWKYTANGRGVVMQFAAAADTDAVAIYTAANGSAGGTATLATALKLGTTGVVYLPSVASASGNDLVCYTTSNGLLTYASTVVGCVPSAMRFKNLHGVFEPARALAAVASVDAGIYTYKEGLELSQNEMIGLYADQMCSIDPRLCHWDKNGEIDNYDKYGALALAYAAIKQLKIEFDEYRRLHP